MDAIAIDDKYPDGPILFDEDDDFGHEPVTAKRIIVYGVTGSGKTTAASRLSEITGIPWQEVDALMWDPGWKFVPLEMQRERIAEICQRDEWILDAAYAKWIDIPMERVQLIVCLDYSRFRTLRQLFVRTVSRCIDKKKVCNGNVESWRSMFSRESILVWHFKSYSKKKERMQAWHSGLYDFKTVLFKNPIELDFWMAVETLRRKKDSSYRND